MAVFRVQKTQNYTIMSNHHLRNKTLSLKAKGLLSLMLSLPEDWDYTTRGLASICKEGVDSVCATVRELEAAGYIIRRRIRDKNGQMRGMEYMVLEQPQPPEQGPEEATPKCAQPKQAEPKREKPVQENPAQLNTKEIKKEETNNVSNPIRAAGQRAEYRALLLKNIEYPILAQNNPMDTMRLDELVELMLDKTNPDSPRVQQISTAIKELRQEERLCRKIAEQSLEVQQHLTEARRDRAEQQKQEQERARDRRPNIDLTL